MEELEEEREMDCSRCDMFLPSFLVLCPVAFALAFAFSLLVALPSLPSVEVLLLLMSFLAGDEAAALALAFSSLWLGSFLDDKGVGLALCFSEVESY